MRRRAGVGAIRKSKSEMDRYIAKSTELQAGELVQMTKQLEVFRTNLEEFASKYKKEICKNAQFRRQFQEMCAAIGVDPLASGKGFWSVLGMGDFYYELSVQIVEVCLATNYKNGGLIGLEELRQRLIKARGKNKQHQEISVDDLLRAARKLRILGSGFSVLPVGKGQYLVQSIPGELNLDHTTVLQLAASNGVAHVSASILKKKLGWERERSALSLDYMVREGLVWIDTQDVKEPLYWFPSLFAGCISAS